MPLIPQRCCACQGCHFSACLTGIEHGTMVTEPKGQSTPALGCACSWSVILVQSAQGCSGECRKERGYEDDKRMVLRHGGGRHRRAFGRLTSPAACPTKHCRSSPHRRQR